MENSRDLFWHIQNNNNYVYADAFLGNDITGNGTMQKPFRTLEQCRKSMDRDIVCRGKFCENVTKGNHCRMIYGDYWGAAVYDGDGKYDLAGYGLCNMIVRNTKSGNATTGYADNTSVVGVGRALFNAYVGNANYVYGVAGSYVLLEHVKLYMGCIGGTSAVNGVVYTDIIHNSSYKVNYTNNNNSRAKNCTVYNLPSTRVMKSVLNGNYTSYFFRWLFGKAAVVVNNGHYIRFEQCCFANDVEYVLMNGNGYSATPTVINEFLDDYEGNDIGEKITAYLKANGVTTYLPVFDGCTWADCDSYGLMNDPDNLDFTLKIGCDADMGDGFYIGAMPPALRVPIYDGTTDGVEGVYGSDGKPACWDNRTAVGCVKVGASKIYLDADSPSLEGSLMSKVIRINPLKFQGTALYSFGGAGMEDRLVVMNEDTIINDDATRYYAGDTVPTGVYYVHGGAIHFLNSEAICASNSCVVVSETERFEVSDIEVQTDVPALIPIREPNMQDVVYVRCRTSVYATVKPGARLYGDVLYFNRGTKAITFNNRTIAPGESFYGRNDTSYECDDPDYEVAVIFDDRTDVAEYGSGTDNDRLVPASDAWVPAALLGAYWVSKTSSGMIDVDSLNGYPYGSGNYRSWAKGRKDSNISRLDRMYMQFKFVVKQYML